MVEEVAFFRLYFWPVPAARGTGARAFRRDARFLLRPRGIGARYARNAAPKGDYMNLEKAKPAGVRPQAIAAPGGKTVASVRAQYENSPEYRLGCAIIDELTGTLGVGADEVAAMLGSAARPGGFDMLGAQAAAALEQMEKNGLLSRSVEEYLRDENFVKLLREVPAQVAVRLSDAEAAAKKANERVGSERNLGMQEILEKLKARRALPAQTRAGLTASAEPDFSNMSAEEFEAFRQRYFGRR